MDALGGTPATPPEHPLTVLGQAALRDETLRRLAGLPFPRDALITRSLWVIIIGPRGSRTRAVIPVDSKLGREGPGGIAGWCELIARFVERGRLLHDDERALVVLRRPGTATISDADEYIFRVLCRAAARRDTVPWAFYVTTPHRVAAVK